MGRGGSRFWREAGVLAVIGALSAATAGCDGDGATDPEPTPEPEPFVIDVGDLPPMPAFPANPTTAAGVALGRHLFYDPILSGDGSQSCGDCHQQAAAFGDPERFSLGIQGHPGTRNAQVIVNPAWQDFQFWDGREESLEDQAREPVANPLEMDADWDTVVARIAATTRYPPLFRDAFGSPHVTQDRVVMAIAQFQRTFVSANSRFDREARGDIAFTAAEARGEELFFSERAECAHCHAGPLFTDHEFHDIGLEEAPADSGRAAATQQPFDLGKFKTPTLRNVAVSAPYMHDGRFETLEAVLAHYSEDVQRSPNLDPTLGVHLVDGARGLELSEAERQDLIAFLHTLTDPDFLTNPALAPPR
ncbi:MAG: cytochrome c peroxidase [Gemmatimonadota bacterium]|jgi:cytochrome c peroxidase